MESTGENAREMANGDSPSSQTTSTDSSKKPASTMHSATADSHCALLSLPPEIRNRIYEYAVVELPCVEIHLRQHQEPCGHGGEQPALTRTCRQIRNESLGLFYELNAFCIRAGPDRPRYLGPIRSYLDKVKKAQIQIFDHPVSILLNVSNGPANCTLDVVEEPDSERDLCNCMEGEETLADIRAVLRKILESHGSDATSTESMVLRLMWEA